MSSSQERISFKVNDGKVFTTEAHNLRNVNSYKYSGLANDKAVGITLADRGVNVSLKVKGKSTKPAKSHVTQKFSKDSRHALASLGKALEAGHYRADLVKDAQARLSALKRKPAKKYATKRSRHATQ